MKAKKNPGENASVFPWIDSWAFPDALRPDRRPKDAGPEDRFRQLSGFLKHLRESAEPSMFLYCSASWKASKNSGHAQVPQPDTVSPLTASCRVMPLESFTKRLCPLSAQDAFT